jgi:hypothetical protein
MCDGDLAAALELAVGVPQPVGGAREKTIGERLLEEYEEPSDQEIAAAMEEEHTRAERVDANEISHLAWTYTTRSHDWVTRRDPPQADADPIAREALDIVAWDSTLVGAKLHRALLARERSAREAWPDDDPVQNDANGSAKVALISLERSESAWRLIAGTTGDADAAELEVLAARLRALVAREFPQAMAFVRPGFDEPWR